jgi:hypothetical protein
MPYINTPLRLVAQLSSPPLVAFKHKNKIVAGVVGAEQEIPEQVAIGGWLDGALVCYDEQVLELRSEHTLRALTNFAPGGRIGWLSISPDGRIGFVHRPRDGNHRQAYELDTVSGELRQLDIVAPDGPVLFCFATSTAFLGARADQPRESDRCAAPTCAIHRHPWWRNSPFPKEMESWVVSPSGTQIAYICSDRELRLRSLDDDRELASLASTLSAEARTTRRGSYCNSFWSRCGRYIAADLADWEVRIKGTYATPVLYKVLVDLEANEVWNDTGRWRRIALGLPA